MDEFSRASRPTGLRANLFYWRRKKPVLKKELCLQFSAFRACGSCSGSGIQSISDHKLSEFMTSDLLRQRSTIHEGPTQRPRQHRPRRRKDGAPRYNPSLETTLSARPPSRCARTVTSTRRRICSWRPTGTGVSASSIRRARRSLSHSRVRISQPGATIGNLAKGVKQNGRPAGQAPISDSWFRTLASNDLRKRLEESPTTGATVRCSRWAHFPEHENHKEKRLARRFER